MIYIQYFTTSTNFLCTYKIELFWTKQQRVTDLRCSCVHETINDDDAGSVTADVLKYVVLKDNWNIQDGPIPQLFGIFQ